MFRKKLLVLLGTLQSLDMTVLAPNKELLEVVRTVLVNVRAKRERVKRCERW